MCKAMEHEMNTSLCSVKLVKHVFFLRISFEQVLMGSNSFRLERDALCTLFCNDCYFLSNCELVLYVMLKNITQIIS